MQTKHLICALVFLALCACLVTVITMFSAEEMNSHSAARRESHKLHKQMVQATLNWKTAKLHGLGQRIPIVTVNTRNDEAFIPMAGVEGISMCNAGVHGDWVSMLSKNEMLLDWFEDQLPKYRDELVILVDSADVLYGGCELDKVLAAYRKVSTASGGAAVVASAERALSPKEDKYMPQRYAELHERQQTMLKAFGLSEDPWRMGNASRQACQSVNGSSCAYEFLNYGFLMGPVGALYDLLTYVVREVPPGFLANLKGFIDPKQRVGDNNDQDVAGMYMFNNPGEVTLDYAMGITASVGDMPPQLLEVKEFKNEQQVWQKQVWNTVTKQKQCFVHFNGGSHRQLGEFLAQLQTSPIHAADEDAGAAR